MLMVIPPPWRLTPLLFRFFFFSRRSRSAAEIAMSPGRLGESVDSKSDRSESSASSENGNRPSASSMSEIPRDQTSDLTVYCAPWMRSGCIVREDEKSATRLPPHEHEKKHRSCQQVHKFSQRLTLIYVDVPTKVSAMELMSSPDTPKSHILICPFELKRMFDGLMSATSAP